MSKTYLCTDCSLFDKCKTNMVKGVGNDLGKILIVLDYPDKDDDFSGRALKGEVSKKIDWLFEKAGFDRSQCYFTFALKCKPIADSKINKKAIAACRNHLAAEIVTINPKMIIAMGKFAHWSLTDITSISEFRGHFTSFDLEYGKNKLKIPVMPTFSPHKSMGKWEYHDYIIHDLKKVKNFLKTGENKIIETPEFLSVRSKKELKLFYETMMEDTKWSTSDLETTGFKFFRDKIINAGYCTDKNKIFIIPQLTYEDKDLFKKWTKEEIEETKVINKFVSENYDLIKKTVARVNANKNIKYIFHNGKFDLNFARYHGMPYHHLYFDTLLADSIIDENKMHSLNIVAEYYGFDFGAYDTQLWPYTNKDQKTKKSYQHVPIHLLEKYLAVDTYADALIFKKQFKMLKEENLFDYFMNQKMKALNLVTDIEYQGVKFNTKKIVETHKILKKEINALKSMAVEVTGIPDFNMGSDKQVLKYFESQKFPFGKLRIRQTAGGSYSVDSETLKKFAKIEKYSLLPKIILTYKTYTKMAGTYVAGKIDDVDKKKFGGFYQHLDSDKRIHTSFNMATPRTGRYSCSSPSLQTFPRPLKNLPNVRSFIEPSSEEYQLFEADYRALEVFVVCQASQDKVLLSELKNDVDIHSQNVVDLGKQLKNIPPEVTYEHVLVATGREELVAPEKIETLKKELEKFSHIDFKEKRTGAKNIAFGLNYGKEAFSFAQDFNISEDEAERMVMGYFKKYRGKKEWRTKLVEKGLKLGYTTLDSGRKRRVVQATEWIFSKQGSSTWNANRIKSDITRQLMNYPIQGGAHDVFEQAILRIDKRFKEENIDARLMLLIHDGLVGEAHRSQIHQVSKIIREEMPFTFNKGKPNELTLGIDDDYYVWEWYGEKVKID